MPKRATTTTPPMTPPATAPIGIELDDDEPFEGLSDDLWEGNVSIDVSACCKVDVRRPADRGF